MRAPVSTVYQTISQVPNVWQMCCVLWVRVPALRCVVHVRWGVCRCVVDVVGMSHDMCVCVHLCLPFTRQYHKYQTYGRCVACCACVFPHCVALCLCVGVCVDVWLMLSACHMICVYACTCVYHLPDNITSTKRMADVLRAARACSRIALRCACALGCVSMCG